VTEGVLIVSENPSRHLRKIAEVYDRIAFAGVGKYNEYDSLRIAGVRHADLKGFAYSREDVDARSLASAYAQILGQIFTHEMKPMEVEILVAEVGDKAGDEQLFHVLYDGSVVDETDLTVLGGEAEAILERLKAGYRPEMPLADALKAATGALTEQGKTLQAADLEVAVLSRSNGRRAFRRLEDDEMAALLR